MLLFDVAMLESVFSSCENLQSHRYVIVSTKHQEFQSIAFEVGHL